MPERRPRFSWTAETLCDILRPMRPQTEKLERFCGLDVGSRTIGLAVLEGERLVDSALCDTGRNPVERCRELLKDRQGMPLVVTGYGRDLARERFGAETVTEISAVARGARMLYDDVGTVLDIGGQDSKIISVGSDGQPEDFRMNDRCAAGTGKYLEMMAKTMELSLEAFIDLASSAERGECISSLCAVYAESEMISLLAAGCEPADVALGLHMAVADRVEAMVRRIAPRRRFLFLGGVARNRVLSKLLNQRFGEVWTIPDRPQSVAAMGAALVARERPSRDWSL